jgi:hypothetical protein
MPLEILAPTVWVPVVVAVIGLGGVILGIVVTQLVRINQRMRKLEHRDRLSWLYIRSLIDHAYRHGAIPLPEPPDGWLDDTE